MRVHEWRVHGALVSRRLRFLHLTTFYPPYSFGGDAMYIYRLAHALGDLGHEVDVVHCVDSYHLLHPGEPEIEFDEHPEVRRHGLRSGWGGLSPLLTHQTGRPYLKKEEIVDLLRERPYDVVHFHNISLLGPGILEIDTRNDDAIKLYTAHEHWLVCPTHVLWKFNRKPCDEPECLRCVLLAKRPPQLWRYTGMLERCAGQVDRFFAPSRFSAKMHAERGFPEEVVPLPYFIDRVDEEWRDPAPRPHDRPYFLFVGRLEKLKGLQNVIRAWSGVDDCDLLVVGTGAHEDRLRQLAADDPRIVFLGPMPQDRLGPLYHHALGCIVPSITYETFGIVIIEAFARKTPVIVHDLGALPEVVGASGGGFVYRTRDEMLDAIERLRTSESLRSELGESGYRAFVERWSRDAHLRLYSRHLEEVGGSELRLAGEQPASREPGEGRPPGDLP